MSEKVEDLTINYEEDDLLKIKELDKEILSKGAWATILFRYQQWEAAKDAYSEEKYTIRRYRKLQGTYRPQSRFNISSPAQAQKIVDTLNSWLADIPETDIPDTDIPDDDNK